MRALGLLLLSGCQLVFPLEGGGADATDAAIDPCSDAIGHDEDDDGIDDACDTCPGVGDATNADGDDDGVGDACDPTPATACEQRLRFDGFGAQVTALVSATWVHDGDDLLQANPSANIAVAHYPSTSGFTDVRVRASTTILEHDTTQTNSFFAIGSGGQFQNDEIANAIACALFRDQTEYEARLLQVSPGTQTLISGGSFSGDETSTFTFELVNRPDGSLECSFDGERGQGRASGTASVPQPTGEVFVIGDDSSERLHWFEVIANTCPR